jgi:hypothetical protein
MRVSGNRTEPPTADRETDRETDREMTWLLNEPARALGEASSCPTSKYSNQRAYYNGVGPM